MAKHRWTGDTPLVRHDTGEVITDGQEFDATPHELRCWGESIDVGSDFRATRDEMLAWGARSDDEPASSGTATDESETDTQAALEKMSYRELQRVAARIDGVLGNQRMADLRAELYDHPDTAGVTRAVVDVLETREDDGEE